MKINRQKNIKGHSSIDKGFEGGTSTSRTNTNEEFLHPQKSDMRK